MNKARIHDNDIDIIVSAQEILEGKYSKNCDFVDPEYEFRVTFVKRAKNHGVPYFRLYWSLEDYQKFAPERREKYEILKGMNHFAESEWHRTWEEKVSSFSSVEKYIKNNETKKYKRADAYIEKYKLCIEFQHSYIANDFEERNEFYSKLGYKVVWLYDLTKHNAKTNDEGNIEILEDNARGFYKIAEEEKDLSGYPVFIQVKDGTIYKVLKLYRKQIDGDKKSTVRYFKPDYVCSEQEFISALKNNDSRLFNQKGDTIRNLWNRNCKVMVFENLENGEQIAIYSNKYGKPNRDFRSECITYQYVDFNKTYGSYKIKNPKFYSLSHMKEKSKIWMVLANK